MKTPQELASRALVSADAQNRQATNTKRAITVLRGIAKSEIFDDHESEMLYRTIGLLEESTTLLKKSAALKALAEKLTRARHEAILTLLKGGYMGTMSAAEKVAFLVRHSPVYVQTEVAPTQKRVAQILDRDFLYVLSEVAYDLARSSDMAPAQTAEQAVAKFKEQAPQLLRAAQTEIDRLRPFFD